MAFHRRDEITHEMEVTVEFVSAKARLVEDVVTGDRYWVPKSQTYDINHSGESTIFIIVVSDWWYKKKEDFVAKERE